ncbi:lactate utilization protein B [Actinomadura algeriensis]|uniref:L-lactate dehydrogenase complex protein LldF n=1 Tax=Actinomadura algeriensis TaxID=1679523 RepID=A0ABR9K2A3_9ACTN|nr:LUD domain-containing protein [Actinomadura algeriensis]MBE1536460.1 L-lactate dehydrogenase complex protein LldF [Actinomadura algeriensis]
MTAPGAGPPDALASAIAPGEAAAAASRATRFADAARPALADTRLRRTLGAAVAAERDRAAAAAAEPADWEELREAGRALRDAALLDLDTHLESLERAVTGAGGTVHWAADAAEARRIVVGLVRATGARDVLQAPSATVREAGLPGALARAGVTVRPAGLGDLIVGLGEEAPSHLSSPALHRDRAQVRELFLRGLPGAPADLSDDPADLAGAARAHLRDRFTGARVAVTGAAFLAADTGTAVLTESGGEGRMCLTLPGTLITVAGIDKVVPSWTDLEVLLQLLPRASSGDRMTPYVSAWTGVHPGDGPREFHLVLLDNGRTRALADEVGRAALRCIRCSACLNVCPVYERTGGGPYGPVLPGPVGAMLTPQLRGVESAANASLPFASTLCGACADVCPVKIDIPAILVHLRGTVVESRRARPVPTPELVLMRGLAWTMGDARRYRLAVRRGTRWARLLSRGGRIRRLPGLLGKWTDARDVPAPPARSFRDWQGRR